MANRERLEGQLRRIAREHEAGQREAARAALERDKIALLEATVRKQRAEKKVMHEMLTEAGIREDVLADGVRTCLAGRLAVALVRLPKPAPSQCPGCRHPLPDRHTPGPGGAWCEADIERSVAAGEDPHQIGPCY